MKNTMTIRVLCDNNVDVPNLKTGWGFSCLVESEGQAALFDAGHDALTLLGNVAALRIFPSRVQKVVLSHLHRDHVGGLEGFLALNRDVTVFVPRPPPKRWRGRVRSALARLFPFVRRLRSSSEEFRAQLQRQAEVVEVDGAQEIAPGVLTTGAMGDSIPEQGIVLDTPNGAALITGCAHPGIVPMVERACALRGSVYLVMGGFHLHERSPADVASVVSAFRRLGVRKVAPCHCSGDAAREAFHQEYREDFIPTGVGTVITTT
jgi:7,8-dihydropterin-6-yl-methyl-4-(beta-D-ribofuranosyl)aminobenzene 5'-phosphate synthase